MRTKFASALVASLLLTLLAPSSAKAVDYPASHCEVFVDRVGAYRTSHGYSSLFFYIKTLNWRLDGPIASVGFHGRMMLANGATCASAPSGDYGCQADYNVWKDYPASAHAGSADYWSLNLVIGNDFILERYYEGAFYVRTTQGTTYWVNPWGGGNFFLDRNMHNNVQASLGRPAYSISIADSIRTADRFPYLNPGSCY
jgi:hypothetical protein